LSIDNHLAADAYPRAECFLEHRYAEMHPQLLL
jgi:hypothetical protein